VKVAVFTGNQPRHLSLIRDIASIADDVYAVQECSTVFPGKVDDFFRKSQTMQDYFSRVIAAEKEVFGEVDFLPSNAHQLVLREGDLNMVPLSSLSKTLECDLAIVFGASYIKSPLIDELLKIGAVNIHMGVSPFYRGSSCNFWALYDGNAHLVGATIHMLTTGLDSGGMLYHALPARIAVDPFLLGMLAVRAAHTSLLETIRDGCLFSLAPVQQDKSLEIRYTRNAAFTDAVAEEYLKRNLGPSDVESMMAKRQSVSFCRPWVAA